MNFYSAAIATIMKLEVYVEIYHTTAPLDNVATWYRCVTWALTEHGLSLFAASILALRPLTKYVSKGWVSVSNTLYGSSRNSKRSDRGTQSWLSDAPESSEMNVIGVRNDVSVYTEYNVADRMRHPMYVAEAYNESRESQKRLVDGRKRQVQVADSNV